MTVEFQKGEHLTATKLNELARAVGENIRGDGIITVSSGAAGTQIGLNLNTLQARIPKQKYERILWGKSKYDVTSANQIFVTPCDINGDAVPLTDVIGVYLKADKGLFTAPHNTKIASGEIIPFCFANDGFYYAIGRPVENITNVNICGEAKTLQIKSQTQWVLFACTESDWQNIGTPCPTVGVVSLGDMMFSPVHCDLPDLRPECA